MFVSKKQGDEHNPRAIIFAQNTRNSQIKIEAGLSNRLIVRVCKISNNTTNKYVMRAEAAGLHRSLFKGLNEDAIYQKLFQENNKGGCAQL
jgi:hypothetical protein